MENKMGIRFKEIILDNGEQAKLITWDQVEAIATKDASYASLCLEIVAGDIAKVKLFKYSGEGNPELEAEEFLVISDPDSIAADLIEIPMVRMKPSEGIGVKDPKFALKTSSLEEENKVLKKQNADFREALKAHSSELFKLAQANR